MESSSLRVLSIILTLGAIALGGIGMCISFLFLSSFNPDDITAGEAGFIAGAILIGSGVIALAVLASRPPSAPPPALEDTFRMERR